MSPRVIKRYPNRRLYDLTDSRYITLKDVYSLVAKDIDIICREAGTRADITRTVLLQVLLEREQEGKGRVDVATLRRLIRSKRKAR